MEKYVLAFVTHKLMHTSMKPHLYFTGGVLHQLLTTLQTSKDYYYEKFMVPDRD